jgi:hypothetical protein
MGKVTRVLRSLLVMVVGLVLVAGCSFVPPAPSSSVPSSVLGYQVLTYDDNDMTQVSSDFPTFLGIDDAHFKKLFKPGIYRVVPEIGIIDVAGPLGGVLRLYAYGIPGAYGAGGTVPSAEQYEQMWKPYMFYCFPASMGEGGALWRIPWNGRESRSEPGLDYPNEDSDLTVILYAGGNIILATYPASVVHPLFARDWVAGMILLVEYAWRGLSQAYPDLFPTPFPSVNPSPYTPPADGSLPTAPPR